MRSRQGILFLRTRARATRLARSAALWSVSAGLVIIVAGTAGTILAGGSEGSASLTISQAVVIDRENFGVSNIKGVQDKAIAINDDATSFTTALEFTVGQEVTIDLPLTNNSDQDQVMMLSVEAPPHIRVDVEAMSTSQSVNTTSSANPLPTPLTTTIPNSSDGTAVFSAPAVPITPISNSSFFLTGSSAVPPFPGVSPSISSSWVTGRFLVDLTGSGTLDTLFFVLSDPNVFGSYDTIDISSDDSLATLEFGEGPLVDGATGVNNDERASLSAAPVPVTLGGIYRFLLSWTSTPTGAGDATLTSTTWFTGSFDVDGDGDGVAAETVHYVLSDLFSLGLYTMLNLSMGDTDFGEGALADGVVNIGIAANTNDEQLLIPGTVILGTHLFFVAGDVNPDADGDDARIISQESFTGIFLFDVTGDGVAESLDFVLVDTNSDGVYTKINLDANDNGAYDAGEELSSGDTINLGGNPVEVTFTANGSATLGRSSLGLVAQLSSNTWLTVVSQSSSLGGVLDGVRLRIAARDASRPGFFQLRTTLRPN